MELCIDRSLLSPSYLGSQFVEDHIRITIEEAVNKLVHIYSDLDMYVDSQVDKCVKTINGFEILEKKRVLFEYCYKAGVHLNDLKDEAEALGIRWGPILEKVQERVGLKERSLQMYMRVARRDDLDAELFSKPFSYVYDYVVGLEDIDADSILPLKNVVDNIHYDEKNSKDRKRVARKTACKLIVGECASIIGPDILEDLEILIDSSGEITKESFLKLLKGYVAQDVAARSEYVENFVETSTSRMKPVSRVNKTEPVDVVLARVKGDLESIVDRGVSFDNDPKKDLKKSILQKIKIYIEAISCI